MYSTLNSLTDLTSRIQGCWHGKAIGGTLGGPHEGKAGPLNLQFYTPLPTGILPNDDLDLQLVWLHHLKETGSCGLSPRLLMEAWQKHVDFPFDEYGICLRNAAYGLHYLQSGAFDNWFAEGMGAAIRSEVWACLAPGQPERAAGFAWCDAVCDHAGDGIWAEVFLAALQSSAFVESNTQYLLDSALDLLPASSKVKQAITNTRIWWEDSQDWLLVRKRILEAYDHDNFTDVTANLAFIVLAWLAGEGDFGASICIATNCGRDTDCTAATLGALLGILSPDTVPEKWKLPIGEEIVLSPQIARMTPPRNINELVALTSEVQEQLKYQNVEVGEVLPRKPPAFADSPLRIPARIGWTAENHVLVAVHPPVLANAHDTELAGHWIRRESWEFEDNIMLLGLHFFLEQALPVRVCGWSQTKTAVWIDQLKCETYTVDQGPGYCNPGGPSFHRRGPGIFDPPTALRAGWHTLTIAWERPQQGHWADLVTGIARESNNQWLPWALVCRSSTKNAASFLLAGTPLPPASSTALR